MDQTIRYIQIDATELADLKAHAKQLESIINRGPSITFIWELSEGWPVAFVSESISFFGYQPAQFFDGELEYAEIIMPEDLPRIEAEVESNLAHGINDFYQRYRIRTKAGNVRWISDWTHITRNPDGSPCQAQGIILDITDSVQAEDRAQHYLRTAGNIFIALDANGIVTEVNDKTLEITEATRDDIIGSKWIDNYIPEEVRSEIWTVFKAAFGKNTKDEIFEHENEIVSSTARRRTIHWYFTVDRDANGNVIGIIAFGADTTDQRLAEAKAQSLASMPLNNPSPVFRIDNKSGDTLLANDAANALINGLAQESRAGRSQWSALIKLAKETDIRTIYELKLAERSFLFHVVPVMSDNYTNLYGTDVTDLEKTSQALSETLKKTIFALSSVLEARDPYTAGHEERVSQIAVKIGESMGLDEGRLHGLELAATIHDIGKIKIPSEILSKPTRLSKAEFNLIKTHPEAGANFIKDIDFDWPLADIIEQHHERMDGSGYPKGLMGKDILLEARILGVADTLEAAASHRPYRPGLGIESAMKIIQEGAGTSFDADIVKVCVDLINAGEITL